MHSIFITKIWRKEPSNRLNSITRPTSFHNQPKMVDLFMPLWDGYHRCFHLWQRHNNQRQLVMHQSIKYSQISIPWNIQLLILLNERIWYLEISFRIVKSKNLMRFVNHVMMMMMMILSRNNTIKTHKDRLYKVLPHNPNPNIRFFNFSSNKA